MDKLIKANNLAASIERLNKSKKELELVLSDSFKAMDSSMYVSGGYENLVIIPADIQKTVCKLVLYEVESDLKILTKEFNNLWRQE